MTSAPAPQKRPVRPLSPHLQIWRWTPTMAASISHRATGVALYAGTLLLGAWLFAIAVGGQVYDLFAGFLGSPLGVLVLFGYAWSLAFHSLNGLRHLYWDAGRGLDVKHATQTAWLAFVVSVFIAIFVVATGLASRGAA